MAITGSPLLLLLCSAGQDADRFELPGKAILVRAIDAFARVYPGIDVSQLAILNPDQAERERSKFKLLEEQQLEEFSEFTITHPIEYSGSPDDQLDWVTVSSILNPSTEGQQLLTDAAKDPARDEAAWQIQHPLVSDLPEPMRPTVIPVEESSSPTEEP